MREWAVRAATASVLIGTLAACGSSATSVGGEVTPSTVRSGAPATTSVVVPGSTGTAVSEATVAPVTAAAPMTTVLADPVGALRNAKVVDPATKLSVQLADGVGMAGDGAGPNYAAASLDHVAAGQRWPAYGLVSFNHGVAATLVSVVALDPSGATKVSEAFGDRNTIKAVSEVDGVIRVEYLEYANDEYPGTGGSLPATLTFDPATGTLTKAPVAQPERLDKHGMTTDGIKPLAFGDPVSRAEALTGTKAKTPTSGMCDPSHSWIETNDGLTLSFADGQFIGYYTESPSWSTPSGGTVGMSVSELTTAIPSAKRDSDYPDSFVVRSGGNTLHFSTKNGRVSKIVGALNDREC